jgi:hypothetical protein
MRTPANRRGFRDGTSLVEVMLSLLVFMVVVLGSAHYRYLTALTTRNAEEQLTGADLAATLLGTWQGMSGSVSFDPCTGLSPYLTISVATGDSAPNDYTLLGAYDVVVDSRTYRSTLYWRDVESDLRELGVTVSWPLDGEEQQRTFQLTTYIRL